MATLKTDSLVGCRELKSTHYTNKDGIKEKLSVVEYIPYGAVQREEFDTRLWGIIKNYDGSIVWTKGAVVYVSKENALKDLTRLKKAWSK